MRKIIVAEFISLDGVVEAPDQWHFPYVNEEMFEAMWSISAETDTMLLGRVTYESYAGAFANAPADDQIAAKMNRPDKVVVSNTLTEPAWAKTTVLGGDVVAGVTELKQRPGQAILTTGSISLARTLLRAGLVDELNLLVHPIVVGHGTRLFEDDGPNIPLSLAHSATTSTGIVHAVYHPTT
ncbi:MAG: dihydrofolate reductase family protein [Mycobacteriales bacterium]